MSAPYAIGFDVGGTRLKSGAVTRGGRLRAPGVQASGFTLSPRRLVAAVIREVGRLERELGRRAEAVGLAFPGAVHPERGVVLLPGKIKGLEGYPIVPELRDRLQLPVVADNDGRVSMLAESRYGLARDRRWAVTVTIGTGVGSGVLLDGQVLRDRHLQFGNQLSHLVLDMSVRRLCITGARGTGDMLCSATALTSAVRDTLARGLTSQLTDTYARDPRLIDFEAIIRAVRAGDRVCTDEFELWVERLGWLLVNAVHAYAPEIVILSGGATNAADLFLDRVRAHVDGHTFRYPRDESVPIELSRIRNHQGVLGAAALAWDAL